MGLKKPVHRVIREAEHKVADESTERQQQHPLRPLGGPRVDETVCDEQEAQAGVRRGAAKGAAYVRLRSVRS
jgi:hypothetical protein